MLRDDSTEGWAMNEKKQKDSTPTTNEFGLPVQLGPYQVVVWNLTNDPPTARLIDLPDPREGFVAAFNRAHSKQNAVAGRVITPPK